MLYYIWIDAEHRITVDDGKRETAGEIVSLQDGRIVSTDDENEDDAYDGAASLADIDVLMTEIYEMLARQRHTC